MKPGEASIKERKEKTIEFDVDGATVTVGEHATLPRTAKQFVGKFDAHILNEEGDSDHLALAMRVRKSSYADETYEVLAFTRGLICLGEDLPESAVDGVFEFCASMRPAGGVLEYARRPEVEQIEVFGLPTTEILTEQFVLNRIEFSEKMSCDFLAQNGVDYKQDISKVEVLKMPHGNVRTYWSTSPHLPGIGSSKVWAVRGKYCCGAAMDEWFEHASREDLRALANICDQAEQPGWPDNLLPDPVAVEERAKP